MTTDERDAIERRYMLDVYHAELRYRRRMRGVLPAPRPVRLPLILERRWESVR